MVDLHGKLVDHGKDAVDKLSDDAPELLRSVRRVWVVPPAQYTGVWVTWYVNGQKEHEVQYRSGKIDGTYTTFYDNGAKEYERHLMDIHHGGETGWHRNGKKLTKASMNMTRTLERGGGGRRTARLSPSRNMRPRR